ncbi:MAG: hypothetical protein ACI4NJ_03000 [Cellvibrio sp.]
MLLFKNPPRIFICSIKLTAKVGGRVINAHRDGFGVCIEGKGIHDGEIFLAFRGTTRENNDADLITDARIGLSFSSSGASVHSGFHYCFLSMADAIRQYILGLGKVKHIHCIGHSLGGAVATLAADWAARALKVPVTLYTFGAPRVGGYGFGSQFSRRFDSANTHRVYHRTDPVPLVPLYPYMHAPLGDLGHYLPSTEPLSTGGAHSIEKYIKSVEDNNDWSLLRAKPEQPYTLEIAIENWLKSKSPVNPASPTFWRWIDSAIIYVMKKISINALHTIQIGLIGTFTLADKIAYFLEKGISFGERISIWVERLMRKIMQAVGMQTAKGAKELTRGFMRFVLMRLTAVAHALARAAIQKLNL